MGFILVIKRELVHQFLMGLRAFMVVGKKSLNVDEQVCDITMLLLVWCCLLANKFTKPIVIIFESVMYGLNEFSPAHELGFMGISC